MGWSLATSKDDPSSVTASTWTKSTFSLYMFVHCETVLVLEGVVCVSGNVYGPDG